MPNHEAASLPGDLVLVPEGPDTVLLGTQGSTAIPILAFETRFLNNEAWAWGHETLSTLSFPPTKVLQALCIVALLAEGRRGCWFLEALTLGVVDMFRNGGCITTISGEIFGI